MNGAAAHWLILTKNQAARANSVRLDLALILLPGSSTSGPGVLGTLPCSEQVTVETDRPRWRRGELNPGPMTEPTVFYVRSLLAKLAIFLPPSMSQTTDGEHIRS